MGPTNIKFVGAPCGQHGPYTFYKAFKFTKEKKPNILSLGEFFYVKIFKDVEVCIGELQLLWEDRYNQGQLLCMVRLYFLPEQTPEGRKSHNGEDEVLMESDKVPFLLEDLVSLLADTMEWAPASSRLPNDGTPLAHKGRDMLTMFAANNRGLDMSEIQKERTLIGDSGRGSQVVIVNYPQYCRYRAMLKRLEGCRDKWLRSLLITALGGIAVQARNTRVFFCRDSFEHPVIQEHELRQDHLAPNLRGRPKKKRAHFRKYEKDHVYSNESDEDSNDSVTSSEKSRSSPAKVKDKIKLEKPSNCTITRLTTAGKRALKRKKKKKVEEEEEDEIDQIKINISPLKPSHKEVLSKQEERFLKRLALFIREKEIKIARLPMLGFKEVDLYEFYNMTIKLGGYEHVTNRKLWKQIYDALGGNPSNTSAATCTRRHYEKMLLKYEKHLKGDTSPMPEPVVKVAKKRKVSTEEPVATLGEKLREQTASNRNNTTACVAKRKIKDLVPNESEKENVNQTQPIGNVKKVEVKMETEDIDADVKPAEKIGNDTKLAPVTSDVVGQSGHVPTYPCVQSASLETKPFIKPTTEVKVDKSLENEVNFSNISQSVNEIQKPANADGYLGHVKVNSVMGARLPNNSQGTVIIGLRPEVPLAHSSRIRFGAPTTGQAVYRPPPPPPAHAKQTVSGNQSRLVVTDAPVSSAANQIANQGVTHLVSQALQLPSHAMNTPSSHATKPKVFNNGAVQITRAHQKPPAQLCHRPADAIGHSVVPTSRRGGIKPFLNPPPKGGLTLTTKQAWFESPDVRHQPAGLPNALKRGFPYGAGYLKEMHLRTPPPAHCNPDASLRSKLRTTCGSVRHNSSNNFHRKPEAGAKKPRLVSDFLSLQASSDSITASAPPRNPFTNKSVLLNTNRFTLSQPQQVLASMTGQIAAGSVMPFQPSVSHASFGQDTTQDTALDLSAKPLRIQTNHVLSCDLNKPSSPIIISPASIDEPIDLCVKKKSSDQAAYRSEVGAGSRVVQPHVARPPSVIRAPSVAQATPVIQAMPAHAQTSARLISLQVPPAHTVIPARPPTPGHATPGHATPGHATPGHATPGHVTPGHATPGYATPAHATPGHASLGHVTRPAQLPGVIPTPAVIPSPGVIPTPVLSVASVVRPTSGGDVTIRTQNIQKCVRAAAPTANEASQPLPQPLSPAVASLLHPAFLNATSLSFTSPVSVTGLSSTNTQAVQSGTPYVLPVSQLVSASGASTVVPYMIPMHLLNAQLAQSSALPKSNS